MLEVMRVGASQAPWFVWPAVLIILAVSVVVSLIKALGTAATGITAIKSLAGARQTVAGGAAQALRAPLDLTGDNLALGVMANPVVVQLTTIMAAVQLSRKPGSNQVPTQFLTPRLISSWASMPPLPSGMFNMTELHVRPLAPTPVGERMLVWFKGRMNLSAPFTEYWLFVTSAPLASLPPNCPGCGAPTAGSETTGVCQYCHTVLVSQPAGSSGTPATWLVDDISLSPPAAAAA